MRKTNSGSFRLFVIFTYLLFWLLFLITGGTVYLKAPEIVQTIMKNICAWTSTFILIILFKRLYPNKSFVDFLKCQFRKVSCFDFIIPMLIQVCIVACSIACLIFITGKPFASIKVVSISTFIPLLLINLTSGPLGEELGWRSYALNELQQRYSPLVAALIIGLVWGLWHFPLWLISGYSGYNLLWYSASFMVGILSFSVFLTFFYNKSRNILVAVWIHFLFNMLLQIAIIDDYKLIVIVSLLYLLTSTIIALVKKEQMLRNKVTVS